MKASRYNHFIDIGDGYAMFNALTNAISLVDNELKTALEDPKALKHIPQDMIKSLAEEGFVIEDHIDERMILKTRYDKDRYDTTRAYFRVLPTYRCNLACTYCYEGDKGKLGGHMGEDTAKKTVKFIKDRIRVWHSESVCVTLYGGEPMFNPKCSLYILEEISSWGEANNIGVNIHIISNGTLFTPKIVAKLAKLPVTTIMITIGGPKEVHDKIRPYKNGKGSYDDIINSLKLLKEAGLNPKVEVDVGRHNYRLIEEVTSELQDRGLEGLDVGAGRIRTFRNFQEEALSLEDSEISTFWTDLLEHRPAMMANPKMTPVSTYLPCVLCKEASYIIDPSGTLYKCSLLLGMEECIMGNINEDYPPSELTYAYCDWMARDPLLIEECSRCAYLPICKGGCPGVAKLEHGTYHAPACDILHKDLLGEVIKDYLRTKQKG